MRLSSGDGRARVAKAVWAVALALGAFAILIPAARWVWDASHLLVLIMAFSLAYRLRILPEKPAATGLFTVWALTVAWSA